MNKLMLRGIFFVGLIGLMWILYIFVNHLFQKPQVENQTLCKNCNIILITMTNLRFDHVSSNGYFRTITPNLDILAKESLTFDNAFSHSSWTLPEYMSIYTSLYPFGHGIMDRLGGLTLSPTIPTLVDILNKNGYLTGAFTGGNDYNNRYDLTNRFSHYEECIRDQIPAFNRPENYGHLDCTIPKALNWLEEIGMQKFFLHIQGFDAHCPFSQNGGITYDKDYQGSVDYAHCLVNFEKADAVYKNGKKYYQVNFSPELTKSSIAYLSEEDITHLVALYDESINDADRAIGTFLNELKQMGLYDNTIIIFTSEHGDMFGKNGRFMRGSLRGTFYDDVLRVPLFIKSPKLTPKKIDGLVEQIDIMPTVLDMVGLKSPSSISGKSLLPLIINNKQVNAEVFAGLEFNPPQNSFTLFNKKSTIEAIRTREWKLIREKIFDNENNPVISNELFNLVTDKEELHNVAGNNRGVLKDLLSRLDNWSKSVRIK